MGVEVTLLKQDREKWRCDFALNLELEALVASCGLRIVGEDRCVAERLDDTTFCDRVWCHAKNEWQGEFFFSILENNQNPDQSVNKLITFLSEIERSGSTTCIHVIDFGVWSPPAHLPISKVRVESEEGQSTQEEILVVMPSLSLEKHQKFSLLKRQQLLARSLITREIILPCDFDREGTALVDTTQIFLSRSGVNPHRFQLIHTKKGWSVMVKAIEADVRDNQLEGEFILGKLTLSLEDYLALEPGDEIEISNQPSLSGVFQIDGLAVASGAVTLEEGKLTLKMSGKINKLAQTGNIL